MSAPHRLTLERDGTAKCICCLESFPPTDVHELSCWHAYCSNCVRVMFTTSFQSEGKFPPHCCDTPIDLTPRLVPVLGKEIWSVYIAKRNEFRTKTRVYCSNTNCGSFITDDHQFDGFAICGKCDSLTCTNCKNPYHDGDCSLHDGSHEIKELAKKEGWVECYKCGNILEKMEGCDQIKCSCGERICYKCSNAVDKCTCRKIGRPRPRGRPLRDLGGFDRQERQEREAQRLMLEILGRGESAPSSEEEEEEDEEDGMTLPVLITPKAPLVTTSKSAPSAQHEERSKNSCNHHSKKTPLKDPKRCPRCRRSASSYVLRCKECNLIACWKCFKNTRRHEKDKKHQGY